MQRVEHLLNSNKYELKSPYKMTPEYVTIHETGNNAPAMNEVKYMVNNNLEVGFHACIDDKVMVVGIPFDRNAWHAGDGENGTGNRKSIGIEIAYQTGTDEQYRGAIDNAIEHVAYILTYYGLGVDRLRMHGDWNGKDCPKGIRHGRYLNWEQFKQAVQNIMNGDHSHEDETGEAKQENVTSYSVFKEYAETGRFTCTVAEGIVAYKDANLTVRASKAEDLENGEYTNYNHVYYVTKGGTGYVVIRSATSGNYFPIRTFRAPNNYGEKWGVIS